MHHSRIGPSDYVFLEIYLTKALPSLLRGPRMGSQNSRYVLFYHVVFFHRTSLKTRPLADTVPPATLLLWTKTGSP